MSSGGWPRALGGGPLAGTRLSKYLYLDESGIGDIRREPTVVVAGVLLDTDTQWRRAAARLEQIAANRLGRPRAKAFHAKELFNGGKEFDRATIQKVGWPILSDLVCMPRDQKLVVVWGKCERAKVRRKGDSVEKATQRAYTTAFSVCLLYAEEWMSRYAEVTST